MGGVTGLHRISVEEGGAALTKRVRECKTFIAGKLGTSEFDALNSNQFGLPLQKNMFVNAGLFGSTGQKAIDTIISWRTYMLENIGMLDEMVLWNPMYAMGEEMFARSHTKQIKSFLPLRAIEPYYQDKEENRWTLAVTSFCVVSPFKESIEGQWSKRDSLFPFPLWSSSADFKGVVRCGYSPALTDRVGAWPSETLAAGWMAAVTSIVDQCVNLNVKLVLVGAGCLSLPICFELKKRGISAIHTGGATQILFGVRGARWSKHDIISTFFNGSWSTPLPSEIPSRAGNVEGGCYWVTPY
jgi:hypothetical protein